MVFGKWANLTTAITAIIAILWSYWAVLVNLSDRWSHDPQYSHGWLVPLFSTYLLYARRSALAEITFSQHWWGLGLGLLGIGSRLISYLIYFPWLDPLSLLICLAGLAATLGGRRMLLVTAPAIFFLIFMIPLPYRLQQALGGTLQAVATSASTYVLQTFGVPAISEGNIILLSKETIGVVEACNGMSMLVTFVALAVGFALVINRHWLYTLILVFAAIPVAVGANVLRIAVTGLLFESSHNIEAKAFYHDFSGWIMMPLGALMLMALLWVMDRSVRRLPSPI
jgi:exosortase